MFSVWTNMKSALEFRIKSHSPPFRDVRNMARLMSGIWPVKTGHFPDIKKRCPGNGQFLLSVFRTSKIDVRDMDVFYWPYSGHQLLMSGKWPVFTGHIPDIKFLIKLMSGIWPVMSGIRTVMSGIRTMMSGIRTMMSGRWTKYLSLFRTSIFDVRNMDRENCPCPGHQSLMSGTWTENTVHVPDINFWCPEYGQRKLSICQTSVVVLVHIPDITVHIPDITVPIPDITVPLPDIIFFLLSTFRTSKVDVRNMDSENWPSPIFSVHIRDITVHIPDIKHWCPGHGQVFCPCSGHRCPCSGHHCPYSGHHCPYSGHQFNWKMVVWNVDRENCPCPGHRSLMSGTWTENTVHVPDINLWCPE